MIIVSGFPFDINEIIGEYPQNSVERQVLQTMNESSARYTYSSVDHLKFELLMRWEIVNAARELNSSGLKFMVFHDSICNPEYWNRTQNGGFRLKSGASPYDAINDIFANGDKYGTECATAMVIVYYRALSRIFSREDFNRMFPDIYLMNWHSLDPLLKEIGTPRQADDILIGDRVYFANPDVSPKTPELQGENTIVLPDNLYYGHGMGIRRAERIIAILNANRKEGATRSAYLMDTAARPNFKRIAEKYFGPSTHTVLVWQPFPV